MKIRFTMKDPDGVGDAIDDAVETWAEQYKSMEPEVLQAAVDAQRERLRRIFSKWFKYDEYLTLEIDTDTDTITVIEMT